MELDDLYGLPLDRFIAERGALQRALRADGQREAAADVAGMRKPSVAAWTVNQLVRTQGGAVEELFDAGDALREAQAQLLAGRGDGRTLRDAREREREAVQRLLDAARGLPASEGPQLSDAVVERVADTLHAAALDEDARQAVRGGRLERELRHVGLGLGEGSAAAPPPAAKGASQAKRGSGSERAGPKRRGREERAELARQRAEVERVRRERAADRKAARTAEATARRRAERAARALRAAEERRERAVQALAEADDALASAREEAGAAATAQRIAQADLEQT